MANRTYDHAWRKARAAVLEDAAERDGGIPRCRIRGPNCATIATQVDHIIEVDAGGARLDPNNLRPACGPCNGGRAAKKKAADGWRRAKTRIVLIAGPPGAGKSTYAQAHAKPEDLVIDYDEISAALGPTLARGSSQRHSAVMAARNAILTKLRRGELDDVATAWLISTNPRAEAMFPHHELVLVDPGLDVVLEQAAAAGRPASMNRVIRNWYRDRAAQADTTPGTAPPSREW